MNTDFTQEMKFELEKGSDVEVRIDPATRLLYSTDASIYQIEPLGVVYPRSTQALGEVVSYAATHKVPILPRGSGSSLAGQAVGEALVIDCSRYLTDFSIDPQEKAALVEPGVVLSHLNAAARACGLQFGPDPASGERATLGGMIANNATGAHSIRYGMTGDHLLEMDVFLADGAAATLKNHRLDRVREYSLRDDLLGRLYRSALDIRQTYGQSIKERWPRTWRNASGYPLNYLLPWSASAPPAWDFGQYPPVRSGELNLAPLMAGSEGTLAVFSGIKLRLVDLPKHKVLLVLEFDDLIEAVEAAPGLLEYDPAAIELVPRAILDRARRVPAYAARLDFLQGSPEALLLVEFSGENQGKLMERAKGIPRKGLLLEDERRQRQIWDVRKVGLGLLMSVAGDAKPIPFVEDIAVPVDGLGAFVREFRRILEAHGTQGDFYAHASAGCLHIRPWVNLKTDAGIELMKSIASELVSLVLKHGGALSGEHGDGIARAGWMDQIYGPEIVEAFRKLKQAADPHNLLNPGKVVDPLPISENLRYGPEYSSHPWKGPLDFSDQENLAGAIEMCNGAGVCRKSEAGMCPTFQATREEMHSTRGRANLLRALISGRHPVELVPEQAAFEALELCLACKACKAECPSGVDMSKLKYAFLDHHYRGRLRPLRDYLFAFIGDLARVGRFFRLVLNPLMGSRLGKMFFSVIGLSPRRAFPRFLKLSQKPEERGSGETVLLVTDPYTEYFTPELEFHAREVLRLAGCRVIKLEQVGTGRTKLSKGFLKAAKWDARRLLAEIRRFDPEGRLPVVGIEPSEVAALTDDILSLLPGDAYVENLAKRAFSIEEFLLRSSGEGIPRYSRFDGAAAPAEILLHGHCYQKAQKPPDDGLPFGVGATTALFEALGCDVEVVDSGCCGMAGAFGYEEKHFEISRQVAELHLLPTVREKRAGQVVVAPGASCRTQISDFTGEQPLHPVSLLYNLLGIGK